MKKSVNGFTPFSIAWAIQVYIDAMDGNGQRAVKPLCETHRYNLKFTQRTSTLAAKDARELTEEDVIEHCEKRLQAGLNPATIQHDIGYVSVAMKYVKTARKDCRAIKSMVIQEAMPFLKTNGYVGKSTPRTRMPTPEEIKSLIDFFSTPRRKPAKNEIVAMPDIIWFAMLSSRRVSEICSITHGGIDWEHKDKDGNPAPMYTVLVRKKKRGTNPIRKFPLFPELAEIIKRQPRVGTSPDERIFPYRDKSVSAKYTRAKKVLKIENLRFHDCRRSAITLWLKVFTPHQVSRFVSGNTPQVIISTYDATDPAGAFDVREKASQQAAAA